MEGSSEERCAKLIKMGMSLGELSGAVVVDEGYTDEEIRTANETVKRLKGPKFAVLRGRIHMTGRTFAPDGLTLPFDVPRGSRFEVSHTSIQRIEG